MLWFFCANPAAKNGETTVCDGRQFFAELINSTKELFSQKQLKFTAKMNQEEWQKKYNPHSAPQLSQREITDKKQGKKNKNRHLKPKKTFKQP
jgi:hypothetical protein